jgi:hypothetical protein
MTRQTLVAVDPGKDACGVSFWSRPKAGMHVPWTMEHTYAVETLATEGLTGTGSLDPQLWMAAARPVYLTLPESPTFLVLETMQVYVRGTGDPKDLLLLQGISGCLMGLCGNSKGIGLLPAQWKGQVPREVYGARMEKHLRAGLWDRVTVPRLKTFLNDAMHAYGLGKAATDRHLPDMLFR